MALIPWHPFRDIDRWFGEDWDWIPMFPRRIFSEPAMNVYQTDKDVVVELGLPGGIDPKKVDISVEGDILTVKGEHEEKKEEKDKHYIRREISRGAFERMISLPVAVKSDKVDASYKDGLLKIVLPKKEMKRAKKIKVKVKK